MFGDLDWLLNASRDLSAIAQFLVMYGVWVWLSNPALEYGCQVRINDWLIDWSIDIGSRFRFFYDNRLYAFAGRTFRINWRLDAAWCDVSAMPVRRGHVAPQNTFIDTIIRKFDGQSKFLNRKKTAVCYLGLFSPWVTQFTCCRRRCLKQVALHMQA